MLQIVIHQVLRQILTDFLLKIGQKKILTQTDAAAAVVAAAVCRQDDSL